MAHIVTFKHIVDDFDGWKRAFDRQGDVRRRHGLHLLDVIQNVDNPSEILVIMKADNLDQAREFWRSSEDRATLDRTGVEERREMLIGRSVMSGEGASVIRE